MSKLTTPVPAVQGFFNDRIATYSTAVSAAEITGLLGHDPRPREWSRLPPEHRELYEYVQRKPDKSRRESVMGYIEERLSEDPVTIGAFPSISVAFIEPVEFTPMQEGGDLGMVLLPLSKNVVRILIDGLARVAGALEVEAEGGDRAKLLSRFTFPVTIYAPRDGKQLRQTEVAQLFHDFNFRVKPVSREHAMALDSSDPYIALANRLGERDLFERHGGVAQRVRTLGSKSTELVTQQNLVRFVRGATEGPKFQTSSVEYVPEPNLTKDTFNSMLTSIYDYLSTFAEEMGDANFGDRSLLHLTALGWQALGVLHYDIAVRLKLNGDAEHRAIKALAAVDWSRSNPDWIGLIGDQEVGPDGKPRLKPGATRRQDIERMFNYLRVRAGLSQPLGEAA